MGIRSGSRGCATSRASRCPTSPSASRRVSGRRSPRTRPSRRPAPRARPSQQARHRCCAPAHWPPMCGRCIPGENTHPPSWPNLPHSCTTSSSRLLTPRRDMWRAPSTWTKKAAVVTLHCPTSSANSYTRSPTPSREAARWRCTPTRWSATCDACGPSHEATSCGARSRRSCNRLTQARHRPKRRQRRSRPCSRRPSGHSSTHMLMGTGASASA